MFFKTIGTLALIFFTAAAAWAMGARIHPEALSPTPGQFVELEFKGGAGSVIGKVTYEDARGISVRMMQGTATFSRNEIANVKELAFKDMPEDERRAFQLPFFTMRREDSLFYSPPQKTATRGGWVRETEKRKAAEELESAPPTSMAGMLSQVQAMAEKQQEMSRYREKMVEEYAEGMEGGYEGGDGGEEGDLSPYKSSAKSSSSGKVDSSIDTGFEFDLKNS